MAEFPQQRNSKEIMVANRSDQNLIEVMLERGHVYRMPAIVRLTGPSEFTAWSAALVDLFHRLPYPGSEMIDTMEITAFKLLLKKAGKEMADDFAWKYSDDNVAEHGIAQNDSVECKEFDDILKPIGKDIKQKKTGGVYVYTGGQLRCRIETKANNKLRQGVRQWIRACAAGGMYAFIGDDESHWEDDIGGIYRKLLEVAEKPSNLGLVNLLDDLFNHKMENDDLTTYTGQILQLINKINNMSARIPDQELGQEIRLSKEFGRILVLRAAFKSTNLRVEVDSHVKRDPKATVSQIIEGIHERYRLLNDLTHGESHPTGQVALTPHEGQLLAVQGKERPLGGRKPYSSSSGGGTSSKALCFAWKRTGQCRKQADCIFSHPELDGQNHCFRCSGNHNTKTCNFNGKCHYCGTVGHPETKCRKKVRELGMGKQNEPHKGDVRGENSSSFGRSAKRPRMEETKINSSPSPWMKVMQYPDNAELLVLNGIERFSGGTAQLKKFSPRWVGEKKVVRFLTDSGANWTGYPNSNDMGETRPGNIEVSTAESGVGFVASEIGCLQLKTLGGYAFPTHKNVLASKQINDPLLSAYRICSDGFIIVLTKYGQQIYEEKDFRVTGKLVITSEIDPVTKQYGIDLEVIVPGNQNPFKSEVPEMRLAATYYLTDEAKSYLGWHARLGHISSGSVMKLLPQIRGKDVLCPDCAKGKMVFLPHFKGNKEEMDANKHAPGEFVSSDMDGPYKQTVSGVKYVNIFLDKGSKVAILRFLKTKDQHATALREVVAEFLGLSGRPIRFYKRDKDGSHTSREVEQLLVEKNIVGLFSAGGDSRKNASVEQRILRLQQGARTNMIGACAPEKFKYEAFSCAGFTYNHVPSMPQPNGKYLSKMNLLRGNTTAFPLDQFHTFGCKVFCRLPDARIGPKSVTTSRAFEGVMLGYSTNSHEFRIWDLRADKLRLVSFNMCVFHEGEFPFRSELTHEPIPFIWDFGWGGNAEDQKSLRPVSEVFVPNIAAPEFVPASVPLEECSSEEQLQLPGDNPESVIPMPGPRRSERIKQVRMLTHQNGDQKEPEISAHNSVPPMMHRQEVMEAPQGQRQAKRRPDWELFFAEECEEIRKLKALETWFPELESSLPRGRRAIRMNWVYAIKRDPITGEILKRKARLCVMGCFQQAGVDYFEVDARVANFCGIRICFAEWIADPENEMEWWDVTSAFPTAMLEEEIWVKQPEGHEEYGPGVVLRLKRALYGTKQAARAWQLKVRKIIECVGGTATIVDKAVYKLTSPDGGWLIIPTHVDDFFPVYNRLGKKLRDNVWKAFSAEVEINNFGSAKQCLGAVLTYDRPRGVLKISHDAYIRDILDEFLEGYTNGKWIRRYTPCPVTGEDATYMEDDELIPENEVESCQVPVIVGKLWWTVHVCRGECYIAVGRIAKRVTQVTYKLLRNLKFLLEYLASTLDHGLIMARGGSPIFTGAADASWADQNDSLEPIKMKSTLGWDIFYRNCLIGYGSRTSSRICGSSTEAECMAVVEFAKLNSFCRQLVKEFGWHPEESSRPTEVLEDNLAVVSLAKENSKIKRSRHFDISWYLVKEYTLHKEIQLLAVRTDQQHADIFTKPLPRKAFETFRDRIMGSQSMPTAPQMKMFQGSLKLEQPQKTENHDDRQQIGYLSHYYYAVVEGIVPLSTGVYVHWAQCGPHVKGVSGAKYKRFKTQIDAMQYLSHHGITRDRIFRRDTAEMSGPPACGGDVGIECYATVCLAQSADKKKIDRRILWVEIFRYWPECEHAIEGRPAVIYQRCRSIEEATEFISMVEIETEIILQEIHGKQRMGGRVSLQVTPWVGSVRVGTVSSQVSVGEVPDNTDSMNIKPKEEEQGGQGMILKPSYGFQYNPLQYENPEEWNPLRPIGTRVYVGSSIRKETPKKGKEEQEESPSDIASSAGVGKEDTGMGAKETHTRLVCEGNVTSRGEREQEEKRTLEITRTEAVDRSETKQKFDEFRTRLEHDGRTASRGEKEYRERKDPVRVTSPASYGRGETERVRSPTRLSYSGGIFGRGAEEQSRDRIPVNVTNPARSSGRGELERTEQASHTRLSYSNGIFGRGEEERGRDRISVKVTSPARSSGRGENERTRQASPTRLNYGISFLSRGEEERGGRDTERSPRPTGYDEFVDGGEAGSDETSSVEFTKPGTNRESRTRLPFGSSGVSRGVEEIGVRGTERPKRHQGEGSSEDEGGAEADTVLSVETTKLRVHQESPVSRCNRMGNLAQGGEAEDTKLEVIPTWRRSTGDQVYGGEAGTDTVLSAEDTKPELNRGDKDKSGTKLTQTMVRGKMVKAVDYYPAEPLRHAVESYQNEQLSGSFDTRLNLCMQVKKLLEREVARVRIEASRQRHPARHKCYWLLDL